MNPNELKLPAKGFTKLELKWLELAIERLETNKAIPGRNISISNDENGQTINADDCKPCP